ncbi:16S rRNA (guanine(527)-N(7))-methyltransferase RsmG [Desulfocastanea catecholica]
MFDFRQRLETGLHLLGLEISPASVDRLAVYFAELKKWSRKINLIAKSAGDEQIVENHFLDSLTLLPLIGTAGSHLLDIGTGAGFPALVCKAACPELAVTLVEPREKRVSFLGHIVRTLGLTEVRILSCRVEDEIQLPSATAFSHITARAVTEIGPLLQMVERFAPSSPQLVWMKGPRWQEEITAAAEIVNRSSFRLDRVVECALPFSGAERRIVIFTVHEHNEHNEKNIR